MSRILRLVFLMALLPDVAFAQFMQISGAVVTSHGDPIPGCVVQLLNPDVGPSYTFSTGATGDYYFPQVPRQVHSLYAIEVQWNHSIIYRGLIHQPGRQAPIVISVP